MNFVQIFEGGFFVQFSFKKRSTKLYLAYSLTFGILALFIYGLYAITGHQLVWYIDAANQHLPILESYRQTLLDFLRHPTAGFPTWSPKMGLGADTFSVYSYYVIGDIFDYITLLFPASKVVLVYQWLIIIRMYCAGLAFCFFASHFNFKTKTIIAGAGVYLFNAFLFYANIAHPFFIMPFIIFPLVIWALERVLVQKSAWPLLLVFTWMLVNNFYFAFMLGIGAIIYLLLRVIFTYRTKLNYFQTFSKLAWASLVSLFLAAGLLLPEFFAVTSSTRAGSAFANGLTVYPLYYYLTLPGQLINGANRDFYFWSALGFASISFYALVYVFSKFKTYPVLATSFILGGIMFLIPAIGALFNGGMSPSNRWSLMLCLPMALSVCLLLEALPQLDYKLLKRFIYATLIYSLYLGGYYFFDSDTKLLFPLLFLYASLGGIIWFYFKPHHYSHLILTCLILANVLVNALYFAAPYAGNYSNELLPKGSYQKVQANSYFGLDKDLTQPLTYRVSTISNNYFFGSNYDLYNALNGKLALLNSYYSLQNNYLGIFMNDLENTQYEATRPIGQVSDRTILNNFFGVRYIFGQINQPNANKIPAGYYLDKMTRKITDTNHDSQKDTQAKRYATNNNFPLVYWQNNVFSYQQYQAFSPSQKERALASGVVVSSSQLTNLKHLSTSTVKANVLEVPYQLISSKGNLVSSQDLTKQDASESYQIVLATKNADKKIQKQLDELYANSELHLEITDISYKPFSLKEQVSLEKKNNTNDLTRGLIGTNSALTSYKYFRYHILKGSPDESFALNITSPLGTEKLSQPTQAATSFYKVVKNGTVNVGYFNKLPNSLTLTPTKLGHYSFKLKVVALPLNNNYYSEVAKIQQHGLKNLTYMNNGFKGQITTNQTGILTSSIPYSKGWSATVDGQPAKIIRTNEAFLGLKLPAGHHQIKFTYQIPGLALGKRLSLIGLALLLVSLILSFRLRIKIK